MLEHGIKELHNIQIVLPKHKADWPDQELLERRYHLFKKGNIDKLIEPVYLGYPE
jgi:hypothetical protein